MLSVSRGLVTRCTGLRSSSYRYVKTCSIGYRTNEIRCSTTSTRPPPRTFPKQHSPAPNIQTAQAFNDENTEPPQATQKPRIRYLPWRYVRILISLPILAVGFLHLPYECMTVTGASMSPLLNPNYSSDADAPSGHRDHILVQKHKITDLLFDVNAGRKNRRKAEGRPAVDGEDDIEDDDTTKYKRGEIIVYYGPHRPGDIAIKRIIGLPGDRVQPRPGYPGGDEAVLVPWNHLWVEGDARSRDKSLDSNWYGPVSQNLVIGELKAVYNPGWYMSFNPLTWRPFRWIDWKEHRWPALEEGRVEESAVMEAASDPHVVSILREWTDGTNRDRLEAMKTTPEIFAAYFASSEEVRKRVRQFYRNAALVVARDDPESERFELAQDMIFEMEKIYGKGALRQGMIRRSTASASTSTDKTKDQKAAIAAERNLQTQGWELERDAQGNAIIKSSNN